MEREVLTAAEAAVLETFVVPRYLAAFASVALDMMLVGEGVGVAHVGCRTGHPDRRLLEKSPNCRVVGVDHSPAAVELARNKAATLPQAALEYHVAQSYPSVLPSSAFSHALTLHPVGGVAERKAIFSEMKRVLYARGQALISMPLRGSFQELMDLFREYSLKYDEGEFAETIELAAASRLSIETLAEELEDVGFADVDVELVSTELTFSGGRAFIEDPTTRLLVVPDLESSLGDYDLTSPLAYVCDAIDEYWSESDFGLTVKIGCASARKR